jgi:polyferredoxin
VGHRRSFKYKKLARWVSLATGLVVLGFVYNAQLTLTQINSLLMGFWPQWQTHLYWYLLLGGILFVVTVDNKNPYCEWFCPFGAAQDCLGAVGGAKPRVPARYRTPLLWAQRGVAWAAIILALLFRNPGLTSYEVFGTLFQLTGSTVQFVLLGLVLVTALFLKRPWCNYLCPLRPVTDLIRFGRGWLLEQWQRALQKAHA